MDSPPGSLHGAGSAARTGIVGTVVGVVAFFDGAILGLPIAFLAATFNPLLAYAVATVAVIVIVTACCAWLERSWDAWAAGNGGRLTGRMHGMRESKLMRHPVSWIERGSDRWYALAAAIVNPILVMAFARGVSGDPVGQRRISLGAVAYAIPYAAMWTLVGLALGSTVGND